MPTIITTTPEQRHIAQVLEFPAPLATHIAFDKIAGTARQLGANFDVRFSPDGGCTITMFWEAA